MKRVILGIALMFRVFTTDAQNPIFSFGKKIGGTSLDIGKKATMDKYGNIYTVGTFRGIVDFDPGTGTYTLSTSSAYDDVFISKLDNSGNFLWAKSVGITTGDETVYGIAVDSSNNILITGTFYGSNIDFDPGLGTSYLSSYGPQSDIYILKLDNNGYFKWVQQIGTVNNSDNCYSITTDDNFNYYLSGEFDNTMDFDPNSGVYNLNSVDGRYYVLKLDSVGGFIWAKQFAGQSPNNPVVINYGLDHHLYLTGAFNHNVDFNPGLAADSLYSSNSESDIFILKLDKDGNFKWVKSAGGAIHGWNTGTDIKTNELGDVFVSGWFRSDSCRFGQFKLNRTAPSSSYGDSYVCKLDSLGNFLWVKQTGGIEEDQAFSLAIDNLSEIYITGNFRRLVNFNSGGTIFNLDAGSNSAIFIQKLNTNGGLIWASQIGYGTTYNFNVGYSIVIGSNNEIILTGSFEGTIDSDPTSGISNLISAGSSDILILKLNQCLAPLNPINSSSPNEQNICIGSTTNLSVSTPGIANWYSLPTSSTVIATGLSYTTPTLTAGSYTYYVEASTCTVSTTRTAITVTVNSNCQDVWPGDANSDGIADNLDILELGLHYTQTGTARATTSNLWQSYYSANWSGTITNGANVNHSNCNGDGIINDDDTLAIFNNYNLTHAFKPSQTTTNPALSIVADQSSVAKGTWGTSSIFLGDATTTINTINGVAFTVNYDNTLLEIDSVWIDYITSFINSTNQNLKFRKRDFSNGKLHTATTHTVNGNVNGFGKIATLHYKIKSSLTTDNVLNLSIAQANQSNASGVITPLTAGSATLMALGTSITTNLNVLTNGNYISIHPNPTNEVLTINSTTELQKIDVMAITGQLFMSEVPSSTSHVLHLDHLANGVYFVNLYQNNRIVKREKIILHK